MTAYTAGEITIKARLKCLLGNSGIYLRLLRTCITRVLSVQTGVCTVGATMLMAGWMLVSMGTVELTVISNI